MGFPFFILFVEPIPTISIFLFKSIFFTSPPLNFANSPSKELQNYIFAKKGKKNVKIKKSSKPHKAQLQLTRSTSTGLSVLNVLGEPEKQQRPKLPAVAVDRVASSSELMLGSYCNTRTAAKQLNENCSC
jgi:hypothetical protein